MLRGFISVQCGMSRWCVNKRLYAGASDHARQLTALLNDDVGDIVLAEGISKYTTDWTNVYTGGKLVAIPRTVSQASLILSYCNEHKIPVVPQGKCRQYLTILF